MTRRADTLRYPVCLISCSVFRSGRDVPRFHRIFGTTTVSRPRPGPERTAAPTKRCGFRSNRPHALSLRRFASKTAARAAWPGPPLTVGPVGLREKDGSSKVSPSQQFDRLSPVVYSCDHIASILCVRSSPAATTFCFGLRIRVCVAPALLRTGLRLHRHCVWFLA